MSDATCREDDCTRPVLAKNLCSPHYQRARKADPSRARCSVAGCAAGEWSAGMCARHGKLLKSTGTPYPSTPLVWSACRECGREFLSARRRRVRVLCRRGCSETAQNRRALAWTRDNGEAFKEQQRRSRRKHFVARAAAARRWAAANPDRRERAKAKRRAVEKSAHETVVRNVVFERDNWLCQLCLAPVDPGVKRPDLMCASLDHVRPLIAGGTHSYDNVQLAHLICNLRKGATV